MRYTLKQLEVFASVAETLNMAASAHQVNITPPAIHKHIANLEKLCDVKLFSVVGRKLQLTQHGKQLYMQTQNILREAQSLNTAIKSLNTVNVKTISMAIHNTLAHVLYKTIQKFTEKNPLIELKLDAPNWKTLHQNTNKFEHDFLIIGEPELKNTKNFCCETLFKFHMILVAASNHPITFQPVNLSAIQKAQFLTGTSNSKMQLHQNRLFKKLGLRKTPYHFDSYASIHDAVNAGMGVAFLPDIVVANEILKGKLVKLPIAISYPAIPVIILRKKKIVLSNAAKSFLEFVKNDCVRLS